jgi:hypothetical protein
MACRRSAVRSRLAPPTTLAILVHFLARLQRHQHKLQMLARVEHMTKVIVLFGAFFNVVNETLPIPIPCL